MNSPGHPPISTEAKYRRKEISAARCTASSPVDSASHVSFCFRCTSRRTFLMASLCLPLGPLFSLTRSKSRSAASGLATSWARDTPREAAIMTNGSHLLMHSRIWTIAVSHYMKNAGKSTQIQRLRHEENPCRNVVPAQRNTRNCRSFRHKLHPSVFQAFRAGKEGKNDVRTRTRLLAGKDGFMPAGEIDGHTGI